MSVSKWAYTPEVCDGGGCPGDCDLCDKPKNMEDEDDMEFEKCNSDNAKVVEKCDYIKRSDAARAMAQYMMDTALIDNPEASDRIEEWEGSIAAPVMNTVKAADVVEVVRCKDCKHNYMKSWNQGKRDNPRCHFTDFRRPNKFYCGFGERAEE